MHPSARTLLGFRVPPHPARLASARPGSSLRLGAFALIALLAAVRPAAADEPARAHPVETFRFANGLRLVLAPDPSLDTAAVVVRYDVGSADDPEHKPGLAHLVEHLMFGRSKHFGAGDYARWVARAGGRAGAETHREYTEYSAVVPASSIPLVLWLESDRMAFAAAAVDDDAVRRERFLIADEARDRFCLRGNALTFATLAFYPAWHPYHRDACSGEILGVTLDDVRAFMATWVQPANATVIVVGPFDPAPTRAIAETYFAALPSASPPARPALPAAWPDQAERIDVGTLGTEDSVTLMWRAPASGTAEDRALDIAAAILEDREGAPYQEIVQRGGILVGLGAHEASARSDSVFSVTVAVGDGKQVDDVVSAVEGAVANLGAAPSPGVFDRARRVLSGRRMLELEAPLGRARRLAASEGPPDSDAYASLSAADVQRAVQTYLRPPARVVLVVRHGKEYPRQGAVLARSARP
jgi:predicted Zn-dependent peptidase